MSFVYFKGYNYYNHFHNLLLHSIAYFVFKTSHKRQMSLGKCLCLSLGQVQRAIEISYIWDLQRLQMTIHCGYACPLAHP